MGSSRGLGAGAGAGAKESIWSATKFCQLSATVMRVSQGPARASREEPACPCIRPSNSAPGVLAARRRRSRPRMCCSVSALLIAAECMLFSGSRAREPSEMSNVSSLSIISLIARNSGSARMGARIICSRSDLSSRGLACTSISASSLWPRAWQTTSVCV